MTLKRRIEGRSSGGNTEPRGLRGAGTERAFAPGSRPPSRGDRAEMCRGGSCRRPCRVPARPRMSPGLNPRCPRSHPAERPSGRIVPEPVRSVGLRPAAPSWLTVLGATVPCAEPHPRALPSCCSPARPRAESQSAPRFPSLLPDGLVRPCRPHTCHQEALMAAMSSPAHALSADTAASAQPGAPEPHAADSPLLRLQAAVPAWPPPVAPGPSPAATAPATNSE